MHTPQPELDVFEIAKTSGRSLEQVVADLAEERLLAQYAPEGLKELVRDEQKLNELQARVDGKRAAAALAARGFNEILSQRDSLRAKIKHASQQRELDRQAIQRNKRALEDGAGDPNAPWGVAAVLGFNADFELSIAFFDRWISERETDLAAVSDKLAEHARLHGFAIPA